MAHALPPSLVCADACRRDLEEVLARVEKSSPSGAFLFGSPVNAEAMGVPDYYTHVRKPMWLGRVSL